MSSSYLDQSTSLGGGLGRGAQASHTAKQTDILLLSKIRTFWMAFNLNGRMELRGGEEGPGGSGQKHLHIL